MPDLNEKALLAMTPNRRWASRIHHAWFEAKATRPVDARIYTDYSPSKDDGSLGRVQIWRPGKPSKTEEKAGALTEVADGQDWYGFRVDVKKSARYADCEKVVADLLAMFKG